LLASDRAQNLMKNLELLDYMQKPLKYLACGRQAAVKHVLPFSREQCQARAAREKKNCDFSSAFFSISRVQQGFQGEQLALFKIVYLRRRDLKN